MWDWLLCIKQVRLPYLDVLMLVVIALQYDTGQLSRAANGPPGGGFGGNDAAVSGGKISEGGHAISKGARGKLTGVTRGFYSGGVVRGGPMK